MDGVPHHQATLFASDQQVQSLQCTLTLTAHSLRTHTHCALTLTAHSLRTHCTLTAHSLHTHCTLAVYPHCTSTSCTIHCALDILIVRSVHTDTHYILHYTLHSACTLHYI
jgi:hypothetical protein